MKKVMLSIAALSVIGFAACNNSTEESTTSSDSTMMMNTTDDMAANGTALQGTYTDLNTGRTVQLARNEQTGYVTDATTGEPVEFYVDMNSMDTFYGRSNAVVNNAIMRDGEGKYKLDDAKVKWDGDEMKLKSADSKEKWDGDEYKYKSGDTKVKRDGDESKIKNDNVKIKTDGNETKVKIND